jgi:hypothetical protein
MHAASRALLTVLMSVIQLKMSVTYNRRYAKERTHEKSALSPMNYSRKGKSLRLAPVSLKGKKHISKNFNQ